MSVKKIQNFYSRLGGCGFAVHGARRNASITTRSRFPAWSRTVGFDSRDCFAHYMAVARTKERTLFCAFLLVFCMSHSHAGSGRPAKSVRARFIGRNCYLIQYPSVASPSIEKSVEYGFIRRPGNTATMLAITNTLLFSKRQKTKLFYNAGY